MNATPLGRGFDTHLGFWVGEEDHVSHTVCCANKTLEVYDFTDNLAPAISFNNTDSSPVFAQRAIELIRAQAAAGPQAPPMFLMLAFQDTHVPLQAPQEYIDRFVNVTGGVKGRAVICAMASYLDEAIGNVTRALDESGIGNNTIVIFHSDNGGPVTDGFYNNNFPLRGGKQTLWEGGVKHRLP